MIYDPFSTKKKQTRKKDKYKENKLSEMRE